MFCSAWRNLLQRLACSVARGLVARATSLRIHALLLLIARITGIAAALPALATLAITLATALAGALTLPLSLRPLRLSILLSQLFQLLA